MSRLPGLSQRKLRQACLLGSYAENKRVKEGRVCWRTSLRACVKPLVSYVPRGSVWGNLRQLKSTAIHFGETKNIPVGGTLAPYSLGS